MVFDLFEKIHVIRAHVSFQLGKTIFAIKADGQLKNGIFETITGNVKALNPVAVYFGDYIPGSGATTLGGSNWEVHLRNRSNRL